MPNSKSLYTIFVALGSNLGAKGLNPAQTLRQALDVVALDIGEIIQTSALYRTPCFPAGNGPDFANAVVQIETTLSAQDCLNRLHKIEAAFGRTRNVRWDARTLDLDLLDHNRQILPDLNGYKAWLDMSIEDQRRQSPEQLILPHPRLQDRGFVLVPWVDVAPDWRHPVLGETIAEMCAAIPSRERIEITKIQES